jgi:hypothetical protein
LVAVGLGRRVPAQLNSPQSVSSTPPSTSSNLATLITRTPVHPTILRSTSETKTKQKSSPSSSTNTTPSSSTNTTPSSSTNTTPSPLTKKQHKRTASTPLTDTVFQTNGSSNIGYRARPCYSPVRPNSLVLSSIPPPPPSPSRPPHISHSDSQLNNKPFYHRHQSTNISRTPEEDEKIIDDDNDDFYSAQSSKISTPMVQSLGSSSNISNSQPQLDCSWILDIETEEQKTHKTQVLPPAIDRKTTHVSHEDLERDFLH